MKFGCFTLEIGRTGLAGASLAACSEGGGGGGGGQARPELVHSTPLTIAGYFNYRYINIIVV